MKKCVFLILTVALLGISGNTRAGLPVTSGLVMHLDADTIGAANGDPIATWSDLSSAGNDATQPTAANQPVYVASNPSFNGRAAVSFDGTDDWMELPSTTINVGSFTMFALAQYSDISVANGNQYIVNGQDGGGNDRIRFQLDTTITGIPVQFLWRVGDSAWQGIMTDADLDVHVFGETSTAEGFLDGVSVATSPNTSVENPTAFNIGSYNRGQKDFFGGQLVELVIYDHVLTAQEIESVSAYLLAKTPDGASNPDPSINEPLVEVDLSLRDVPGALSWTAPDGYTGATYDVYFGTTEPNFNNPAPYGLTLIGTAGQSATSVAPTAFLPLGFETPYYWVVDTYEPNALNPLDLTLHQGAKWWFTTAPDDFAPVVTAGSSYITWLANLPQGIDGIVDDKGELDIVDADVQWSVINHPGIPVPAAMQMYDRGVTANILELEALGADPNVLRDWIGTDARVVGDPMILTLSGLPLGSYAWTSTHHDVGDQTGLVGVTVDGVSAGTIDISDSNDYPIETFSTTITSDGVNPVELVFSLLPQDQQPDVGNTDSTSFFVMNGFELTGTVGTLKVDFSQTATAPDPNRVGYGYEAYLASHEVADTFTAQDFAMGTATVTVLPEWGLEAAGLINYSLTKTSTNPLAPTATFTTDVRGDYTIQLTATDAAAQTDSDTLVVRVAEDACQAALWNGATLNSYDDLGNQNCVVDLPDLAALALEWLDNVSLTATVTY